MYIVFVSLQKCASALRRYLRVTERQHTHWASLRPKRLLKSRWRSAQGPVSSGAFERALENWLN